MVLFDPKAQQAVEEALRQAQRRIDAGEWPVDGFDPTDVSRLAELVATQPDAFVSDKDALARAQELLRTLKNSGKEGLVLPVTRALAYLARLNGLRIVTATEVAQAPITSLPPDSPWKKLVDELQPVGFAPDAKDLLTELILSNRLYESPPKKTQLLSAQAEVIRRLLALPDVYQAGSMAQRVFVFLLKNLSPGIASEVAPVPGTQALILFDTWILGPREYRNNAWIFAPNLTQAALADTIVRRSDRDPPVSHVELIYSGPVEAAAVGATHQEPQNLDVYLKLLNCLFSTILLMLPEKENEGSASEQAVEQLLADLDVSLPSDMRREMRRQEGAGKIMQLHENLAADPVHFMYDREQVSRLRIVLEFARTQGDETLQIQADQGLAALDILPTLSSDQLSAVIDQSVELLVPERKAPVAGVSTLSGFSHGGKEQVIAFPKKPFTPSSTASIEPENGGSIALGAIQMFEAELPIRSDLQPRFHIVGTEPAPLSELAFQIVGANPESSDPAGVIASPPLADEAIPRVNSKDSSRIPPIFGVTSSPIARSMPVLFFAKI